MKCCNSVTFFFKSDGYLSSLYLLRTSCLPPLDKRTRSTYSINGVPLPAEQSATILVASLKKTPLVPSLSSYPSPYLK